MGHNYMGHDYIGHDHTGIVPVSKCELVEPELDDADFGARSLFSFFFLAAVGPASDASDSGTGGAS